VVNYFAYVVCVMFVAGRTACTERSCCQRSVGACQNAVGSCGADQWRPRCFPVTERRHLTASYSVC